MSIFSILALIFCIIFYFIFAFSWFPTSSCTTLSPTPTWAPHRSSATLTPSGSSAPAALPASRPSVPGSLEVIYLTLSRSQRSHKKALYATFVLLTCAVVLRKSSKEAPRCHPGGTPLPSKELRQWTDGAIGPAALQLQHHNCEDVWLQMVCRILVINSSLSVYYSRWIQCVYKHTNSGWFRGERVLQWNSGTVPPVWKCHRSVPSRGFCVGLRSKRDWDFKWIFHFPDEVPRRWLGVAPEFDAQELGLDLMHFDVVEVKTERVKEGEPWRTRQNLVQTPNEVEDTDPNTRHRERSKWCHQHIP